MRILMVSRRMPPYIITGGVGSYIYALSKELAKLGHEIHILTTIATIPTGGEIHNGLHLHNDRIPDKFRSLPIFSLAHAIALRNFIKKSKLKIDIIQDNYFVTAFWKKRPTILGLYNSSLIRYLAHRSALAPPLSWKDSFLMASHHIDAALERRACQKSDAVIAGCNRLKELAVKYYSISPNKVIMLPPSVDPVKFNPDVAGKTIRQKLGIEDDQPIVFTLRHLRSICTVQNVIYAARLVLSKRKDAVFIIVGDGPLKTYLRKLAQQLGLLDKILFMGAVPHSAINDFFAASNLVVDPCPIGQGMGVLEAMACGKPVVGIGTHGAWDFIEDKVNGFLTPAGNINLLAEKILFLVNNPRIARQMGRNSRNIVENKYNVKKSAKEVANVYLDIVDMIK